MLEEAILTETVQVALITLSSGAIGAFVGAAGTIFAAKHAAKTQLQQAVLAEYFSARLRAFNDVYDAYTHFTSTDNDIEARSALLDATNRAGLVASPDAGAALRSFAMAIPLDYKNEYNDESFFKARVAAFQAMERDMREFKMPTINKR